MSHNPEKELPRPERKLPSSPEEEGYFRKMELIDGHPICDKCLAGEHEHPMTDEAREEQRGGCKNVGEIDAEQYQCYCGHGGWCIGGKWVSWEENE